MRQPISQRLSGRRQETASGRQGSVSGSIDKIHSTDSALGFGPCSVVYLSSRDNASEQMYGGLGRGRCPLKQNFEQIASQPGLRADTHRSRLLPPEANNVRRRANHTEKPVSVSFPRIIMSSMRKSLVAPRLLARSGTRCR